MEPDGEILWRDSDLLTDFPRRGLFLFAEVEDLGEMDRHLPQTVADDLPKLGVFGHRIGSCLPAPQVVDPPTTTIEVSCVAPFVPP